MNENSRRLLKSFIEMLPATKRKLDPDLAQPNDFRRMVAFAKGLLDYDDTFSEEDIRSVCEEVGEEYLSLIESPSFTEKFASPIYSEIDNIKQVIRVYKAL